MTDLLELFKMECEDMSREFQKASLKGKGTPQEIADFREGYFQRFISKYFPFPYRITKGGIIDTFGCKSASIDCIILNPAHPYTVDNSGRFSIILADGVDSVIEVKPDISNKHELIRGLKQVQSVKKLRRFKTPILLSSGASPNEIEFSKTIPCFIFALTAKNNINDTVSEIIEFYKENQIPLEEQFDYLVINGKGIVANFKYPEINKFINMSGCPKYGYYFMQWDNLTLAGFLLHLNLSYAAVPKMATSILERYLYGIKPNDFGRYECEVFWESQNK